MFKKIWLAGAIVAGGLAAGCADNDVDSTGTGRQEGSLDSYPNQRERSYSPIMGDTAGDGMRRDMRTGGVITGDDVPVRDQLNEDTRTRINIDRQRESTGPIRGDSGTSSSWICPWSLSTPPLPEGATASNQELTQLPASHCVEE